MQCLIWQSDKKAVMPEFFTDTRKLKVKKAKLDARGAKGKKSQREIPSAVESEGENDL